MVLTGARLAGVRLIESELALRHRLVGVEHVDLAVERVAERVVILRA